MILKRIGGKARSAKKIQSYFPIHSIYVSTFFGGGGMYFNKPKSKHNILNDIDGDVFNLYQVVLDQKEKLFEMFMQVPIHSDLLEYWKGHQETDPLRKAIRFLFLSNFTLLGKMDTLHFAASHNPKKHFDKKLERTFQMLQNVKFNNCDFRKFFKSIHFPKKDFGKPSSVKDKTFIYNDPIYLGTTYTYNDCPNWSENDFVDLLDANIAMKCNFAISEFDNPFVLKQSKKRGLNVIEIGERTNLKNRKVEILITNYKNKLDLFNQE